MYYTKSYVKLSTTKYANIIFFDPNDWGIETFAQFYYNGIS